MTDTEKLRERIKENGYTLNCVAQILGLSKYDLQLKIQNKTEFKTSEIMILCRLLKIRTLKEKEAIFFKKDIDLKSSKKDP